MSGKWRIGYWKDHPMLILDPDSQYPFQFGLGKAKLILDNIDTIKRFVECKGEIPEDQKDLPLEPPPF